MKRKLVDIFQIILKIGLVLVLVFFSYEYLNKVYYNKEVDTAAEFKSLPGNSMDVIVLGSSHAQYSFVPSFFYEETGLYSYVLGTSCQPYEVSYEMLKEALKTQSPQMVIMEAFTAMPLRSVCEADSCYVFAEYQMTGKEKMNVINMLPEEKAESYKNDFFTYHNDWKIQESFNDFIVRDEKTELSGSLGYIYAAGSTSLPENWWHASIYGYTLDMEMDEEDIEALNNIYSLCQENGIKLMLYKTPVDSITREDQTVLYKVWEWADEHNVEYIDLIQESTELSFYMNIHSDAFHAYVNGSSIITSRISDSVNKYNLEKGYVEEIDEYYRSNERKLTAGAITYESYPKHYLNRLKNTSGVVAVSYSGSEEPLYNSLYSELIDLGLDNSICHQNEQFYAIVIDGEVVAQSVDEATYKDATFDIVSNENGIDINGTHYKHETTLLLTYYNIDLDEAVVKQIDQKANSDKGIEFYDWDNEVNF